MNITFRLAAPSDAARLLKIYAPYVENTTASLEYEVPSEAEFISRINEYSAEFPYIVCEIDGVIEGYAYAHKYKVRYGYRYAAELSVYLNESCTGKGIGKKLYGALTELLTEMGYKNLYGIVTGENEGSIAFHESLGFTEAGREHRAGYKFGKWIDVIIFEKIIGDKIETEDTSLWCTEPKTIHEIGNIDNILIKYANL